MGLSFHYSGRIKNLRELPVLVAEAEDICQSMNWEYHLMNEPEDYEKIFLADKTTKTVYTVADLYGICFTVPGCETFSLCFLPSGKLSSPMNIWAKDAYPEEWMLYSVSVKTQFAGPDAHITLIKFLKYFSEKYFADVKVDDEGYYWETEDKEILLEQFRKYNAALDFLETTLIDFKLRPGESPQKMSERLEEFIKKGIRKWRE